MLAEDRVRVGHMIDACRKVIHFLSGRHREELDEDEMLRFAVVKAIEIIGEAATHVSSEARVEAPDVPWAQITGMRNRLIHAYFDIDTDRVWDTYIEDIPALLPVLQALLAEGNDAAPGENQE